MRRSAAPTKKAVQPDELTKRDRQVLAAAVDQALRADAYSMTFRVSGAGKFTMYFKAPAKGQATQRAAADGASDKGGDRVRLEVEPIVLPAAAHGAEQSAVAPACAPAPAPAAPPPRRGRPCRFRSPSSHVGRSERRLQCRRRGRPTRAVAGRLLAAGVESTEIHSVPVGTWVLARRMPLPWAAAQLLPSAGLVVARGV